MISKRKHFKVGEGTQHTMISKKVRKHFRQCVKVGVSTLRTLCVVIPRKEPYLTVIYEGKDGAVWDWGKEIDSRKDVDRVLKAVERFFKAKGIK